MPNGAPFALSSISHLNDAFIAFPEWLRGIFGLIRFYLALEKASVTARAAFHSSSAWLYAPHTYCKGTPRASCSTHA